MKTAMQEMIEYLENIYYVKEILDWEDIKKNIIKKEKEQIIDAFEIGHKDGHYTKSNDFYNNIYNQNES
jgi:hypothetical protein